MGLLLTAHEKREANGIEEARRERKGERASESDPARSSAALLDSELRFRLALRNAPVSVSVQDRDLRFVWAYNQRSAVPKDIIGRQDADLFNAREAAHLSAMKRRVLDEGIELQEQMWLNRPSGRMFLDLFFEPIRDETGQTIGVGTATVDLTANRLTEEALRKSEERYRSVFDHAATGIAIVSWNERFESCNPAFLQLTGYTEEELRQIKFSALVHPDDLPATLQGAKRLKSGDVPFFEEESRYLRKDGKPVWVHKYVCLLTDGSPSPSVMVLVSDVTERKRADRVLRNTLHRFYSVLSGMYAAVLLLTQDGRDRVREPSLLPVLRRERVPESLVGLSAEEVLVKIKSAYLHPDEAAARIATILGQGVPVRSEEIALQHGRTCLRDFVPLEVDGELAGRLWIHVDITERKRAEEALREADLRKTEFLAVLSHELRNPLAPIRNSVSVLDVAPPTSTHAKRAIDIIRRQSQHLTRLVDDLLDVTRISRGKILLRRVHVELRDLVSKTIEDLRSVFALAGVELNVALDRDPIFVNVDPTRIAQVIGNLLQNSVKFTPSKGTVTVSALARNGQAEISVRDNGVGMEPKDLERMFEPFTQADQTLARSEGGLGLGLALVKGLVELHQGTVMARSEGLGFGTELVVRLPLAPAQASSTPLPCPSPVDPPSSKLILVVEDHPDAGQSLAEVLELKGHRVHVAGDGQAGIELARSLKPDVVLCDLGLPVRDGYEVARELRADERLRSTRLVALSGYAQPADRRRSLEAGFDVHLAKPLSIDELMSVLEGID